MEAGECAPEACMPIADGNVRMTDLCCSPSLFCRKVVPVGSIAVAKSLVAGLDVCLQNKIRIISLRQSRTVDQAD